MANKNTSYGFIRVAAAVPQIKVGDLDYNTKQILEFYEERWFASANDLNDKEVTIFGSKVPIGTDILFKLKNYPEVILGVEICEDLWAPMPPSSFQAVHGATVIANLSASNELIGKADYRKTLVSQQSLLLRERPGM